MAYWHEIKQIQTQVTTQQFVAALAQPWFGGAATSPDPSIYGNQADLMRRLSWVYSAVTRVAETVASLADYEVYDISGEDKTEIVNHEFERLLHHPNPYQFDSRFEFYEALAGYLKLNGNAYLWLNVISPNVPPAELWVLRPDRVVAIPDKEKLVKGYVYSVDGNNLFFDATEVVHFKTFHPLNDYYGLSAIESLAMAAESDFKQAGWNKNFFGEGNAKPQGAIAYSEMVSDPDWDRIKTEIKDQFGGQQRRTMMLRGAGKGGVQWLQMGLTQKEMEFMAGRQFNKEEIWATLAPGLTQIMDKNTTEANSAAGEKTFREYCIWPLLQRIGEKMDARILPRYGENLLGEFAEIRVRDRILELQERAAFALVHTIDEVRAEYDGDDPLPDARGALLAAQISPMTAVTGETPAPTPSTLEELPIATGETEPMPLKFIEKEQERAQFKRFAKKNPLKKWARFEFKHLSEMEQDELWKELDTPVPNKELNQRAEMYAKFERALKTFESALRTTPAPQPLNIPVSITMPAQTITAPEIKNEMPAPQVIVNVPTQEAPSVNVQVPAPIVNVSNAAPIVNVPEQSAPIVNVTNTAPEVVVNVPAQDAPIVNVQLPDATSEVQVIERDANGRPQRIKKSVMYE